MGDGRGVTLWLDCGAGVAGDMLVAALLDVAEDRARAERVVRTALSSLPVAGFAIEVRRVVKAGLDCCDFNVVLDATHENHDHDMAYLHGDGAAPATAVATEFEPALHGRDRGHDHGDEARGLAEIEALLDAAELTARARAFARKTFRILAAAEAKAHGVPIEQVHFHEVGAVDSIADIVAAAVLVDHLSVERVVLSQLVDGRGTVRCQHGVIPVPVPATLNICAAQGLPLGVCEVEGELVTPTGAALVAALDPTFELPARYAVRRVGLGAGKRSYVRPSIVRAIAIDPLEDAGTPARSASDCPGAGEAPARAGSAEVFGAEGRAPASPDERSGLPPKSLSAEVDAPVRVVKLECDVDDATPEVLAYAADCLREAGAREVHWLPMFAKKGRPAYQLQVICVPDEVTALERIIFREVGTLGIRRSVWERSVLPRELVRIDTAFGEIALKRATLPDGTVRAKPEYEDCAAAARRAGVPIRDVIAAASAAGERLLR